MPEFPGGVRAMLDFIKKNIQYPEIARKNGIQGRVIVGVVVDKNGSVTNLTILKSIDPFWIKKLSVLSGLCRSGNRGHRWINR